MIKENTDNSRLRPLRNPLRPLRLKNIILNSFFNRIVVKNRIKVVILQQL
jgi:hypothetical protein